MYTSLNGMTPLTNNARVAYDVAGLGDVHRRRHRFNHRSSLVSPIKQSPIVNHNVLKGLADLDFGSIFGAILKSGTDIGTTLIQGHYAPSTQNAASPLVGAPASIIPYTQASYLPVSSGGGSNKTLIIVGAVAAAAAVVGFLVLRRKK